MNLKEKISTFIYEQMNYFVPLAYEGGENTTIQGVRVMDDPCFFVEATLVENAIYLYLEQLKRADKKAQETPSIIHFFIHSMICHPCNTWGKYAILRGLSQLQDQGLLNIVSNEDLEILKNKTDYSDFIDKETLDMTLPTNYYHVAFSCAALREKLGWENENYSEKILNRLYQTLYDCSSEGWMDEQPPHHRFDRYSLVVSSELSDALQRVGKPFPNFLQDNLTKACEYALFAANRKGDGINYGRSLSFHGDSAFAEILSSGLYRRVIPAEQIPLALEYIDAIIDKIIHFWYDANKHSINLWWDGRQTNNYRGVERALEVNLDVCNHLKQILHNLSCVGLEELDISKTIPSPKKVECKELFFDKTKQNQDECILFRIKDHLVMLPFVGAGSLGTLTSYMPFPALQGATEVPPSTSKPFYVPEFIGEDETHYRVGQYYSNIQTESLSNGIRCKTNGNLFIYKNGFPQKSDFQFEITCFIQPEQIEITYETNLKYKKALLYIGLLNTPIDVIGDFQIQKEILEPQEYFTPSGSYNRIEQYSFCQGPIHYLIHLA